MIKVHVLHTGKVCVDVAIPLRERNPFAKTGWLRSHKKRAWLPVSVYLIEHPKGVILVDTGWHTDVRKVNIHRKCFLPVSYGYLPEQQAVNEQLAILGYKPNDIDYIFFTHLDSDHTDGLRLVKDAKNIFVSAAEWEAAQKKRYFYRYHQKTWKNINMQTFQYQQTGIGPFGESFDVFGDNSIQLVATRGHSHGLSTVLISHNNKFVALVGDTGYMEKSWKKLILPGLTVNKTEAQASLEWIASLSQQKNCLGIFATHDPKVQPQVIEL